MKDVKWLKVSRCMLKGIPISKGQCLWAVEAQWKQNQKTKMPVWSAVGAKQSKLDCRPARQKHRWVLNYFWDFLSNYFLVINWIDCKSLCKFNSAQRAILSLSLLVWNVQTSDPSACPFLIRPYPSYVQLAREAQSKAVCTGLRQAGIGLASEISEGLVTMFPEKALKKPRKHEKTPWFRPCWGYHRPKQHAFLVK